MFRNLVQLYSMLICFISSFVMLIVFAISINAMSDLLLTEFKHAKYLHPYESNYTFKNHFTARRDELSKLDPKKLEDRRIIESDNYIKDKKNQARYDLINNMGWIISSLLFFTLHWFLYKRSKE